uniref:Uncharacterized protein n=1 Tax=Oryza glumipatula TaxID=40148 RepID=A0A0E0A9F2_9ORYZ
MGGVVPHTTAPAMLLLPLLIFAQSQHAEKPSVTAPGWLALPYGQRQRAWRGWAQPRRRETGAAAAGKGARGSGDPPISAAAQSEAGASVAAWQRHGQARAASG